MYLVSSIYTVLLPLPRETEWCSCSAVAGLSCMQGTCSRQCSGAQHWMFRMLMVQGHSGLMWLAAQGCS